MCDKGFPYWMCDKGFPYWMCDKGFPYRGFQQESFVQASVQLSFGSWIAYAWRMEIKHSKKTVYCFDHPKQGYAMELRVVEAGGGFSWQLIDTYWHGKVNLYAEVDSDGMISKMKDHGADGFSFKEIPSHDGSIGLFFGKNRVYLS